MISRSELPSDIPLIENEEQEAVRRAADAALAQRLEEERARNRERIAQEEAAEAALRAVPWIEAAMAWQAHEDARPVLDQMRRLGGVAPPWHRRMRDGGAALFLETLRLFVRGLLRQARIIPADVAPTGYGGEWRPRSPHAWAMRAYRVASQPPELPPEWAVLEDALLQQGGSRLPRDYAAACRALPRKLAPTVRALAADARKTTF